MTRVALIGFGYWGENLARVFFQLGSLYAICEPDAQASKNAGKAYPKLKVVSDFEEILKDDSVDAVVIATPAGLHYTMSREAILSGKDVFVEKPLSLTAKEGVKLVELAQKRKRILMVGHLLEYHPGIIKLKELIEGGQLGKIYYIYSTRLNLGKFRREENILWSFAPHDISVMLLLLSEMPQEVSVCGGNYLHQNNADVSVSNFRFSSGVRAHIFVSWLHPYKEQKLVVIGDKKMAVFDDVAENNKLQVYRHKINWVGRLPVPLKEDAQAVKFKMAEPLKEECIHFIHAVKKRVTPKTDGRSGVKVLKVLNACQVSMENEGQPVRIDAGMAKGYFVHPTSTVEKPSYIGQGTKVWHYAHIMKNAKIGKNCVIGQNVFIGSRAVLGDNVKVQNNVSVYDGIVLEDDVFCGPSMVFTNVINPRSHISRKNEFKQTLVKKGATLGAGSTIICGNVIGEYAFVGAGAVVTKDIPAYALCYGNPAAQKGWVCKCGKKIDIIRNKAKCKSCGEEFLLSAKALVNKAAQ